MVELDQEVEPPANMIVIRQLRPTGPVDVASRKSVLEGASTDVGQNRLGGDDVDRIRGTVDAPCVRLEVLGHRQRPEQRLSIYMAGLALDEMVDQGQRRDELAILGKVPLERGRQFIGAQSPLKPGSPVQELRRSLLVEPDEGDLVIWALHGPELERSGLGELGNPLEYSPDQISLRQVRIFVNILPAGRLIGPHQQPETLDQPVAAGAIRICPADVFGNLRRLGIAQHPDANRLDMDVTTSDPIEGVRLRSRPAAQVEATRDTLFLAIEMFEQRDELVTLDEKPGRVRHQQRADCLVT